jgi:hypothetical protein
MNLPGTARLLEIATNDDHLTQMQLLRQISAFRPRGQRPLNAAACNLGLGTLRSQFSLLWDKLSHNGSLRTCYRWVCRRNPAGCCNDLRPCPFLRVTPRDTVCRVPTHQPSLGPWERYKIPYGYKHLSDLDAQTDRRNSKRLESRACKNCPSNLEVELLYNGWMYYVLLQSQGQAAQ